MADMKCGLKKFNFASKKGILKQKVQGRQALTADGFADEVSDFQLAVAENVGLGLDGSAAAQLS